MYNKTIIGFGVRMIIELQLLNESEHDIKNYPDLGPCYHVITLTLIWIILDIMLRLIQ